MSWEGRWCDRCDCRHTHLEMCPKAPGFVMLWKMWLRGERSNPMTWAAVYITILLAFLACLSFFSLVH